MDFFASIKARRVDNSASSNNSKMRLLLFLVAFVSKDALCFRASSCSTLKTENTQILKASLLSQEESERTKGRLDVAPSKLLVHWKGEAEEGYSIQFRHLEFQGALSAVLKQSNLPATTLQFTDALSYTGSAYMPQVKLVRFNQAMQFIESSEPEIPRSAFISAAERCSLIHALYEVVAEGESYETLLTVAMQNGGFDDMKAGQEGENDTWCVRVRHYGENSGFDKQRRHGDRTRSMKLERPVLNALKPLLLQFGGDVQLRKPDCKICVFDGLKFDHKVLARRIARGPRVSLIAPNTRICVTNTPLCPIAAFCMCNIAQLHENQTILDPYAGSCTILLAAAMLDSTCRTVGIEIAHNGLVNRDNIQKDFTTRNLVEPLALLSGDSTDQAMRDQARVAIGDEPFDLILTDPPYGIRESTNYHARTPIAELFGAITHDRSVGKRLLKKGGRLVCFVPCTSEERVEDVMPTEQQMRDARLKCEAMKEQPLNDSLSRWLVSFMCIG